MMSRTDSLELKEQHKKNYCRKYRERDHDHNQYHNCNICKESFLSRDQLTKHNQLHFPKRFVNQPKSGGNESGTKSGAKCDDKIGAKNAKDACDSKDKKKKALIENKKINNVPNDGQNLDKNNSNKVKVKKGEDKENDQIVYFIDD